MRPWAQASRFQARSLPTSRAPPRRDGHGTGEARDSTAEANNGDGDPVDEHLPELLPWLAGRAQDVGQLLGRDDFRLDE
jgi:hypothetical protein